MGITADIDDLDPASSRRVLYARIAATACDADIRRAERLLLRGLERGWSGAATARLLQRLLLRSRAQAPAERTS
ncbi:hypothetical protein L599_002500000060 [Luteimonas sp. J16]|jgi:hypothetical protein|uniref:hypothetical protein n=1 Tax=unclassified Luteimonas TaxID=2629088 RepID=UPI00047D2257|nr:MULTISPECIES: hypothetical protein [unclassified Luteimonas]TWG91206.1 hypothetical protein L599_002500000060 [Luteimonas sp. J16]